MGTLCLINNLKTDGDWSTEVSYLPCNYRLRFDSQTPNNKPEMTRDYI